SNQVFHYRVSNYNYFARRFAEEGFSFAVRANQLQPNNPLPITFDFQEIPFSFAAYKEEIQRLQPAVVILFLHLKNLLIWPLLHWLNHQRIPVVYWNKGVNLEVRNPFIRNLPFYYIHHRVNALLLYSSHELKDIQPSNRPKTFIANNAVNFTAFPEISTSKEALKAELHLPFKKIILFVGRMRPVKKVEHLIEVFQKINHPDYGLVIVGDQMAYDLATLIHSPNIRYLGEIFDPQNLLISKIFKASDLFVIPGDVGLGLNQAFFWGLPVVTEDGLQPPEIHYLTNGRNGFIVPENHLPALQEKIVLLLEDDALRSQFSQNAHADIRRLASVETMFNGFLQCVSSLHPISTTHLAPQILSTLTRFSSWLNLYGPSSQDHQDFYASPIGRSAKNLYYKHRRLGTLAVAPMVLAEAFFPSSRRFFFPKMRLPIADAHFAMAFANLYKATAHPPYLAQSQLFLQSLLDSRCPTTHHSWGYPFDWQTQSGVLSKGTPLITTTPYAYDAFLSSYLLDFSPASLLVLRSIAEHTLADYPSQSTSPTAASAAYTPHGGFLVVNASAYRAALLLHASHLFSDPRFLTAAQPNLQFVLDSQNPDGSWPYATDGKRPFIDHFHTCFVLKNLAKAEKILPSPALAQAIDRGLHYYTHHLFNSQGIPIPFSKSPRLTVYRHELYDFAECLNLAHLLQGRSPKLDQLALSTLHHLLSHWIQPHGPFRSRKLLVGWDNVPMHRWGQSQIFRSLSLFLPQNSLASPTHLNP
ncbi:MAG: glycosyltransferase family 4 protein, partial [Verrucomicrobiota bacterium]